MKILKRILIVIVILVAIPLIVALFVKKDYEVMREVTINKPKEEVFEYIRFLKNQDNFSVWNQKDPKMKKSYKGKDGSVGFISYWESKNEEVGTGEQEITKIIPNQRMDVKLRFKVPFEAEDDAYFTTTTIQNNQTKVVWGFKGHFPYPMNIMQLFMDMDEMLGKDLQGGLDKLKKVIEDKE